MFQLNMSDVSGCNVSYDIFTLLAHGLAGLRLLNQGLSLQHVPALQKDPGTLKNRNPV